MIISIKNGNRLAGLDFADCVALLHSYASMHCVTVYRNLSIDVYCHLFIPTCVTLEFMYTGQGNSYKNSVHTCLPQLQSGLGRKVKHLRQLAFVVPIS